MVRNDRIRPVTRPASRRRLAPFNVRKGLVMSRSAAVVFALGASLLSVAPETARAFPLSGDQTVLPRGTELNEETLDRPREIFKSEAIGGRKSYLVNLGDLAFNAPDILGGVARKASMSCGTCHVNGASNPGLYVPGLSTRPGNFDTTGALFNPKADDGGRNPVRIPSLRGARYLAPYGHDGRFASLRDFVHNVVVNEFAGPEPAPAILDAIVAYIQDIDFLPNPRLAPGGRLAGRTSESERRGEGLFNKPFPRQANLSCAGCHVPGGAFVDHVQHDVGSGGLFKTPTLLNANFNAPYFHDGRYDTYEQVVAHFDRVFDLGYTEQDKADLIAYLSAVGDGFRPYERDGVNAQFKEINDFASVLGVAIAGYDADVAILAARTVGRELRELTEQFPDRRDTTVDGGTEERRLARSVLKDLVLIMRRIDVAMATRQYAEARAEYETYQKLAFAAVPAILRAAAPWSLFNPEVHAAHFGALRHLLQTASRAPR
jgi:Di-haem cytochrome c peroxidase